ncbi:MAG: sugar isomerase [Flavobacterium sp. MedPE-SWcel]|uniref:oligosaccharide flippase family protein n=1 Tax=uncultured Flavobacterium sp. TaxID=165435 RepID=UPI00091FA492|nr:oligosaccharide flippase family protein [uncultured Flavobacterium sp.]OIQ20164.1 MAG: sugar isomerase [Flavobacterium sp. MedPE-SWcel]
MKTIQTFIPLLRRLTKEQLFMVTILIVNAGNYLYNLLLGRLLGPAAFADAAVLITFLLIVSFAGMTFQIVTAKYAVLFSKRKFFVFVQWMSKRAIAIGAIIGISIILLSEQLQAIFNTKSSLMFVIFGAGLPIYFIMSVNRGGHQGKDDLKKLSITYQAEMISRLLITLGLLFIVSSMNSSILVAIGIFISLLFGLIPLKRKIAIKTITLKSEKIETKPIITFFVLTAFYELTQIIINNSDILLVKHYFESEEAGLYASLALIGRVVYFVAWMFVMLLLPKVIRLKKDGFNTKPILLKYVGYITVLSAVIVLGAFLFPTLVVKLMFGSDYIAIAPLLWQYALATSIFAIANIFAYYFLSIGQYFPVVVSGLLGLTQIVLIVFFHESLSQVVQVQIIAMIILLFVQLCFFFYHGNKNIRLS